MPKETIKELLNITSNTDNLNIFYGFNRYGYSMPWDDYIHDYYNEDYVILDSAYIGHSGEKYISPLIKYLLDYVEESGESFAERWKNVVIPMIAARFKPQWQRLWDVYQAEYTALNNYDLTESETIADTNSGTESGTNTGTGTTSDSETIQSTAESTATSEGEDNTGIYGFASTKQTSSDTKATTADTSSNTTGTSTTTREGSSSESGSYSKESSGTGNRTRNLTRSGNIGIRSNQELLQQEIDLWQWDYFEQVFKDIDKVLTLCVY